MEIWKWKRYFAVLIEALTESCRKAKFTQFSLVRRRSYKKNAHHLINGKLSDAGAEEGYIEALLCFTDVDKDGRVCFEEFARMYNNFQAKLSRKVERVTRVASNLGKKECAPIPKIQTEKLPNTEGKFQGLREIPETLRSWSGAGAGGRRIRRPKINKKEVRFLSDIVATQWFKTHKQTN